MLEAEASYNKRKVHPIIQQLYPRHGLRESRASRAKSGACLDGKNLRMPVHTGHETDPNGTANGLCDLALVDRSQPSDFAVFYPAHLGDVFRHDGEVLAPVRLAVKINRRETEKATL
jgi:hypothetical protein